MKLHGVFIGIDRYQSTSVGWLSCAKRDAVALHALFADNIDGEFELLTDDKATQLNIETTIKQLQNCASDDVVIIAFSGHGTNTHQIVPYDTNIADLENSTIHLNKIAEWFSKIPARQLICIIDCCFSGGMGAKAIEINLSPRDISSGETLLKQIAGEGRVVLTASKANERAWENGKLGHGLLTYYVLQALQGAEEVRKNGKIGMYRLLDYVTTQVSDAARRNNQEQNPLLLGNIIEEISYPVFKSGANYRRLFPERGLLAISDINSLAAFGFPQQIIDAWQSFIPSLNQLQLDAINDYRILDGDHLVVSAPTSSGKTMIGELAAVFGATNRKRALFLLPLKALVNDKLKHFDKTYGSFGVRTIRATGESTSDDIIPLMRGQYDICLMTYEKFSAIAMTSPFILNQVNTIVVDEVQMIADTSRGINLEFVLTLLKIQRKQGYEPQLITLSAVIGNTNGFERWLGARLLLRTERPVQLDEGIIRCDGSFRYIESDSKSEKAIAFVNPEYRKGSSQDLVIPLVRRLLSEGKSVIIFRETKSEAQSCALYLANSLGLAPAQDVLDQLPNSDPSGASKKLRKALQGGVAFHVSDLDSDERNVIEEHFRNKLSPLKVIAATTTLAMGVNTPAEAVIIAGLMHPGDKPYSIAEYKNIVGRAGRLGFSERGSSFLVALNGHDEFTLWNKYIKGTPEDLVSHFFSLTKDIRSLVIRVIAAVRAKKGLARFEIIDFLTESFGAFQKKLMQPSWTIDDYTIAHAIDSLQVHRLIQKDEQGFYHLTSIGKLVGDSGMEVESAIRVVNTLSSLRQDEITDPTLLALTQLTHELDEVYMPINKKSTEKEPRTWMIAIRNQFIPAAVINAFSNNVKEHWDITLRAKKAVACLLWISNRPMTEIEASLMQHTIGDSASGPVRSVTSRTSDILPVVAKIAEQLHLNLDLSNRLQRLLVRLELGIPASLTDLGIIIGKLISRGEYLLLFQNGIASVESFDHAGKEKIHELLGSAKAELLLKKIEQHHNDRKFESAIIPLELYEA